jgi:hypothetical protein
MAKAKTPNPNITIDGVYREMTSEEFDAYKLANQEVEADIAARLKAKQDKEAVVAKLSAIGITEDDLKGLGL